MKRVVQMGAIGILLGASIAALPAAAANGTFTKITSPKGPGQHILQFANLVGANSIIVSGVVSDDVRTGGTGLDVFCFKNNDRDVDSSDPANATPIPVNSDNSFSGPITTPTGTTCTLRA